MTIAALALLIPTLASAAGNLSHWRFFQTKDGVVAVREGEHDKAYKDALFNDPDECRGPVAKNFKQVTAFIMDLSYDEEKKGLRVSPAPMGALKIFRRCDAQRGNIPQPEYKVCARPNGCAEGEDLAARECKLPGCPGLTVERGGKKSPLTAEDARLPIVAYEPAKPKPAEGKPQPQAAGSDLSKLSPGARSAALKNLREIASAGSGGSFAVVDANGNVTAIAPTAAEARSAAKGGELVVAVTQPQSAAAPAPTAATAPQSDRARPQASQRPNPVPDMNGPDYNSRVSPGLAIPTTPGTPGATAARAQPSLPAARANPGGRGTEPLTTPPAEVLRRQQEARRAYDAALKEADAAAKELSYIQEKRGTLLGQMGLSYNQKDLDRAVARDAAAKNAVTFAAEKLRQTQEAVNGYTNTMVP